MNHNLFYLLLVLILGTLPSCNTDDADDDDNGTVTWPDVTVQMTVTGDAEQTLNFTNRENSSGNDNITAIYDAEEGELVILGSGTGTYMWQLRAQSASEPTVGGHALTDGTYVASLSGGENSSFNELVSGSLDLTSAALLYETASARYFTLSGSFEMVLIDEPGTVNVQGSFTGLVLTAVEG